MAAERRSARAPARLGRRATALLGLGALCVLALTQLDTPLAGLVPNESGWRVAREFASNALRPALDYEAPVPGYRPFLASLALGLWNTVLLAAGGMALAVVLGTALGLVGARVWWERDGEDALGPVRRVGYSTVRLVIALMRSVHELLWAVVLLAAFGLTPFAAAVALSIPYGGTLAKVFSEMLDEEPRAPGLALRQLGASRRVEVVLGLVPGALPNALAYAFYRFECALRAAAVMGFFGLPTIGQDLKLAWLDLHYREVWTYLYAMVALVVVFELWSSRLRRRFVA